ncbi:MAG: hypothetical protein M1484_00010 [Patescibacteria group bacterium]|nr:hypothetical protein [Patescibacteria group bacterium]
MYQLEGIGILVSQDSFIKSHAGKYQTDEPSLFFQKVAFFGSQVYLSGSLGEFVEVYPQIKVVILGFGVFLDGYHNICLLLGILLEFLIIEGFGDLLIQLVVIEAI